MSISGKTLTLAPLAPDLATTQRLCGKTTGQMKGVVISDDLSGAADCAAALWPAASTVAYMQPDTALGYLDELDDAGAVAVDLHLRRLSPALAEQRLARVLGHLRGVLERRQDTLVYIKIDSALRGHVGLVVRAAAHALQVTRVPVVPANPRVGRTTRDGLVYVDGVPLHRSQFANDPQDPAVTSSIVELLRAVYVLPVTGDPTELASWASRGSRSASVEAFIPDIEDELGLSALGADLIRAGCPLVCGSAGLIPHLEITAGARPAPADLAESQHAVVINGSVHPEATRQLATLEDTLDAPAAVIDPSTPFARGMLEPALESLARCGVALLTAPRAQGGPRIATTAAAALSTAVRELDAEIPLDGILTVGGETGHRVFDALRIDGFRTRGELGPGIALLEPIGQPARRLGLKPGSFGDDDALVRAAANLRGRRVAASPSISESRL